MKKSEFITLYNHVKESEARSLAEFERVKDELQKSGGNASYDAAQIRKLREHCTKTTIEMNNILSKHGIEIDV